MAAATTINPNDHLPNIQSEFYSSSNFGLESIYHQLPPSSIPSFPPLPLPPAPGAHSQAQTQLLLSGGPGVHAVSSGSDNEFSAGTPTSPDSSPHSPTPHLASLPFGQAGASKPTILPSLIPPYTGTYAPQVSVENTTRKRKNSGGSRRGRRTSARPTGRKGSKTSKLVNPTSPTAVTPPPTPATPQGELDLEGGGPAVAIPSGQLRELINDAVLKKKRLQRKAELARLSRKKKQTRLAELERQVALLKEENRRLQAERTQLQSTIKDAPTPTIAPPIIHQIPEDKDNSKVLESAMAKLMELSSTSSTTSTSTNNNNNMRSDEHITTGNGSGESVRDQKMNELVGEVAQALKKQSSNVDAAMKVLEQALVPCTAMQFLEWSLIQKEKFYESDGLFMSLFRDEMGGSEEQVKKLLSLRTQLYQNSFKIKDQQLLDAFRSFQNAFNSRARLQQPDAFDQLRTIFTPKQLAVFFKWVNQYGAVLLKVPM